MKKNSNLPSQNSGEVVAVSLSPSHTFSKPNANSIRLLAGLGVEGDAHLGATDKHRSRAQRTPDLPNLRQVHLLHAELLKEVLTAGFTVLPGEMGENITTRGIDLLNLPAGTRLHLGENAVVEVTGLRDPCSQIDRFQPGLKAEMLAQDEEGNQRRKSGVMGIVICGGDVRPGDPIQVEFPAEPYRSLEIV